MISINKLHIKQGAAAGVAGGVVFGIMMGSMKALPMLAMLVGSESGAVGFIVHIVFSALFGAGFGFLFGDAVTNKLHSVKLGFAYGFIAWILGPLYLMPVWLGMGPQLNLEGATNAIPSLWGHMIFGFILAMTLTFIQKLDKK